MSLAEAIKLYFSTPDKCVTNTEIRKLGAQGLRELGEACQATLQPAE